MSATARVGWCPGALRPMASGDGLIVRVKPRGGALRLEQARRLAEVSHRYGNGALDLTNHANLQIRGFDEARLAPGLAALDAVGLVDRDAAAEAVRNVVASPLAGLDPRALLDIGPLAAALEQRLTEDAGLRRLPAKFCFSIDDGGHFGLDDVAADVGFKAVRREGVTAFAVRLAGGAEAGVCAPAALVEAAAALAGLMVAAAAGDPDMRRMRHLARRDGGAALLARAGLRALPEGEGGTERDGAGGARPPPPARAGGPAVLRVAAPFGRIDAARLAVLAEAAASAGALDLRLTPWRAILVPGLDGAGAARAARACAEAGWIVDPADARARVAACPGAPGCRRGSTAVLDDAARLARSLHVSGRDAARHAPDAPGRAGIALHVSGCGKGCAHARAAPLTLVARDGLYDMVENGQASDPPILRGLTIEAAERRLKALDPAGRPLVSPYDYIRDGAAIYAKSFAIIRGEADLRRFPGAAEERVAVRIIHACGMVEAAADIVFSPGAVEAAMAALAQGAPVLCDVRMVADGVTRRRLPAGNEVVCTLGDPAVPALAEELGTTRTAAAVELWRGRLAGAVVAIGNAPTALFHLLEMIGAGAPLPAAIVGMPVGFVGAAESKEALLAQGGVPALVVRGRKGGSAMAAAAVNALASAEE